MQWRRNLAGLAFSLVFVLSYFTNKFVLSVLKFTFPTLFQGWQTLMGAVLLLVSVKLGWVEMSHISRSAALSWLPGSVLFVGNIYWGSRALSRIDIPYFFTLQNASYAVSSIVSTVLHREKTQRLRLVSVCVMLLSAIRLPVHDPQFDHSGYQWAVGHLLCVGSYRVFQGHARSSNLSDLQQQCLNYLFSILLLALAAHPTGDLSAALDFPFLWSYTFYSGCCSSALLGFLLLLATVRLKTGFSLELFSIWVFTSKIIAMSLSPLVFDVHVSLGSVACVVFSHLGEALLLYADRTSS